MGILSSLGGLAGLPIIGPMVGGLAGQAVDVWAGRESAEDQRTFNREEAEANRTFQERMSSTAYQRAVADMEKAGINPMLAYMQGGASTPAGATASSSPASVGSSSASLSSASQAFCIDKEIGLIEQQINKVREEVGTAMFERMTASQMYDILLRTFPSIVKLRNSEAAKMAAQSDILKAEADFWNSPLGSSGVGKFLQFLKSILR